MPLKIALAGNPNSGKTTLFNRLTGSTAHVGNWPGVTVERKEGRYKKTGEDIQIIDLPGIYSLAPYSPEEVITRNYILSNEPDLVINIVDSTNLERNLYLTTQLLETGVPVVIALNMMDVMDKQGDKIDISALEKELGVPVIPISANQNKGVPEMMQRATSVAKEKREAITILAHGKLCDAVAEARDILVQAGAPHPVYNAVKALENDRDAMSLLNLDSKVVAALEAVRNKAADECEGNDVEAATADLRYRYITDKCSPLLKKAPRKEELTTSDKIDRVVTNRILGLPIFAIVLFLVFHLTFTENLFFVTDVAGPGTWLAGVVEGWVEVGTEAMAGLLETIGASEWATGLVIDGIFAGVGAVLGFLPLVLVLYLFLALLESSGYMARAAFIMDRLLRRFGLSGKSFVPMIMGFGCSVPAISATRTLDSEKDRRLTIMLIPFMSCGAKLPIYAVIAPAVFSERADVAVFGMYILGIVVAIVLGIIFKKTLFKGDASPFIMELPSYRLPTLKSIGIHLWEKFKGFAAKVGTIITVSTIVIWFLANFGFDGGFGMVEANSAVSLLGYIGSVLKLIFLPLGFVSGPDGWKMAVAVITGLIAKEAVVSTMGQLYIPGSEDVIEDEGAAANLTALLSSAMTIPAALSFMAWNLLSIPCMAAVGAVSQEMNSRKWFWITIVMQLVVAWVVSFILYWVSMGVMALFA